jgi:hypothetical protein
MNTLSQADEKLRRIACMKRVIRKLTQNPSVSDADNVRDLADINVLEAMILELGGQVREVPYSKSKLRRLDTQIPKYQLLDPEHMQDMAIFEGIRIQHRDVTTDPNEVQDEESNDTD